MSYLIQQIIWFLILTAVLWGAIGWWLRSASHRTQMRAVEKEHIIKLQTMQRARDELRDQLEQVAATRSDGTISAATRTKITEHVRRLENEAKDGRERIGLLTAKLEALTNTSSVREREYETLRQRLDQTSAALRDAKASAVPAQPAPATPSQGAAGELTEQVKNKLRDQQKVIEKLNARIETLSRQQAQPMAAAEHAKLLDVIRAQKNTIKQLNQRPAPGEEQSTGANDVDEVTSLHAALRDREQTIAQLQEQLLQARKAPKPKPDPRTERSGDLFSRPPEVLLKAPEGVPDPLQRINGVGPVLEAKLNDLGIYHFRQIAALSEDDIGWIAAQMNAFPNRILRDRWVEQAQTFLDEP
jgi:predicted flap endonuclease-1-like 5' DNA nuclease